MTIMSIAALLKGKDTRLGLPIKEIYATSLEELIRAWLNKIRTLLDYAVCFAEFSQIDLESTARPIESTASVFELAKDPSW